MKGTGISCFLDKLIIQIPLHLNHRKSYDECKILYIISNAKLSQKLYRTTVNFHLQNMFINYLLYLELKKFLKHSIDFKRM